MFGVKRLLRLIAAILQLDDRSMLLGKRPMLLSHMQSASLGGLFKVKATF